MMALGAQARSYSGETAGDDEGRPYFDFGVFAFQDKDYLDAVENFQAALAFNPDNPLYHQYLGRTYTALERFEDAETHLGQAMALDPELPGLSHDVGMFKYKQADFEAAAKHLTEAAEASPDDVLILYYAGISLFKTEAYTRARDYFLRAAEKSNSIRPNGLYYAGVCAFKAGQFDDAVAHFEAVKADPGAESLWDNADRWARYSKGALDRKSRARRPYRIFLKLGYRYDDNVKLEPDDREIFSDEADSAIVAYLSGNYDFLSRAGYKAGVGYNHYQIWHTSLSEYDLTASIANLYVSYYIRPVTLRFTYSPTYYWADGDSYLREHQLSPEIFWRINPKLTTRFQYTWSDNDYVDEDGQDGTTNALSAMLYYTILNGKGRVVSIWGGLGYEKNDADDDAEGYDRWTLQLGTALDLPWELKLQLVGKYQPREFDGIDEALDVDLVREDDKYIGSISLSRRIFRDWMAVIAEYQYTRNISNVNDFEYSRNLVSVSLTATF